MKLTFTEADSLCERIERDKFERICGGIKSWVTLEGMRYSPFLRPPFRPGTEAVVYWWNAEYGFHTATIIRLPSIENYLEDMEEAVIGALCNLKEHLLELDDTTVVPESGEEDEEEPRDTRPDPGPED